MRMIYAGIGSRKTPSAICMVMKELGQQLAEHGWTLRSGHADGADIAFELGAQRVQGPMEIYLPWAGFNGANHAARGFIIPPITEEMLRIAEAFHPNWPACSQAARKMHCRNVCQVLGLDCSTPADMVVCWTPDGKGGGGTGQAIRIAKGYNIPVFDLALRPDQEALLEFVNGKAT